MFSIKKIFIVVTVSFIILILFVFIEPIRTKNSMQRIAKDKLLSYLYNIKQQELLIELQGPIIKENEVKKYVEFQWYSNLKNGEKASIFILVYKYPTTFSWRDNFFWPSVTMNYQWQNLIFEKTK